LSPHAETQVRFCPDQNRQGSFFEGPHQNWASSAVILANGAWRDRDLGSRADQYWKSLILSEPIHLLVHHKNEKVLRARDNEAPDEATSYGGGLASIDVVKVLQLRITTAHSRPAAYVDMTKLRRRACRCLQRPGHHVEELA